MSPSSPRLLTPLSPVLFLFAVASAQANPPGEPPQDPETGATATEAASQDEEELPDLPLPATAFLADPDVDDTETWSFGDEVGRAPAGVRHSGLLPLDGWNLDLLVEYTSYDGLRDANSDISSSRVLDAYGSAPEDGSRMLTEVELSYGYREAWTLFAVLPHVSYNRTSRLLNDTTVDSDSSGLGDIQFGALYQAWENDSSHLLVNLGLSLPTGSFDEKDDGAVLPYSMQQGTGTWDLHPGVTYLVEQENWSWGAYGQWRVHVDKNSDDWARGDEGAMGVWAAKPLTENVSGSARLNSYFWSDVHGSSDDLDPDADPTADKHLQGGDRIDLLVGIDWQTGVQEDKDRVLSLEAGLPIFEWLDGPQLSTEWMLLLSWNVSF